MESDENHTIYTCTDPDVCTCLENGDAGRDIDPVPCTGEQEEFVIDVTEEEICDKLADENGQWSWSGTKQSYSDSWNLENLIFETYLIQFKAVAEMHGIII